MDHHRVRSKSRRIESQGLKTGSVVAHRSVRIITGAKSRKIESQGLKTGSVVAHRSVRIITGAKSRKIESQIVKIQLPESHDQTDLLFTKFDTQATQRPHSTPAFPDYVVHRSAGAHNFQWSPLGTYLLETGVDALALFAGVTPSCFIFRFNHPMVEQADFSPGEKFLVTYCNQPQPSDPKSFWLKVFNVTTGRISLGLESHVTDAPVMIRWSGGGDDKYFATLHKNTASVYETDETFSLLGQRHKHVLDLSWSPTESILVLLKEEPTEVVLVQFPSQKVLMHKDILSSDCKMYWQSNGKYLAVKVDQQHKSSSLFELFCFTEKGITNVDLKVEKFIAFSWEPSGHRFAVIHGDHRDVSFYAMENGKASLLFAYQNKQVNTLFWSPWGKHIVLAALKGSSGSARAPDPARLELVDVDNDKLETTEMKHPHANNIAWDPTGRYVATSVTISEEISKWGNRKIDDFKMWSSTGKLLYSWKTQDYCLLQLSWRPYGGTIDDEMLQNEESEDESDDWPSDLP